MLMQYREFPIKTGNPKLSFVFNDVMGMETETKHGCHPEDIIKAINGYMKNEHEVNITTILLFPYDSSLMAHFQSILY